MALTKARLQALLGLMLLGAIGCATGKKPVAVFHADAVQHITYHAAQCRLLPEPTPLADFECDKVWFKVNKIEYKK